MLHLELDSSRFCKVFREEKGWAEDSAQALYSFLSDLASDFGQPIIITNGLISAYTEYSLTEILADYGEFYTEETGKDPSGLDIDAWISFLDDYTQAIKSTENLLVIADF